MFKNLSTWILLSVIGFGLTAYRAMAQDYDQVQLTLTKAKPAVVLVFSEVKAEISKRDPRLIPNFPERFEPLSMNSTGSGFIINPDGYVITNGHVIQLYHEQNREKLKFASIVRLLEAKVLPGLESNMKRHLTPDEQMQVLKLFLQAYKVEIDKKLFVILSNGEALPAEVKSYSPPLNPQAGKSEKFSSLSAGDETETGKDVAVLKIEKNNLPTVRLGDSQRVSLQDSVFPAGYPGVVLEHPYLSQQSILDATITSGHISRVALDVKGTPVIQVDAAMSHGNSGGPAFNRDGEVIGISTFIAMKQTGPTSAEQIAGFNFLVPINTAKEFVRTAGVDNRSGLFDQVWSEGIDLYRQSRFKAAKASFQTALNILPKQPDAFRFLQQCEAKIASRSPMLNIDDVENPTMRVTYGVLLALVVLGVGAVLFLRAKKPHTVLQTRPVSTPSTPVLSAAPKGVARPLYGALVCTAGPLAGRRFEIDQKGLLIGRDPSRCQIVIADEHVSKEHAWVVPVDGRVYAIDRGSANGTYLNSMDSPRVSKVELHVGDSIIIGRKGAASFTYQEA